MIWINDRIAELMLRNIWSISNRNRIDLRKYITLEEFKEIKYELNRFGTGYYLDFFDKYLIDKVKEIKKEEINKKYGGNQK